MTRLQQSMKTSTARQTGRRVPL
ncbi:hypothetical protein E2C01_081398 [Portunus trituberculatus]|uniref:Uncharacterized protein n=1 Tax=Portunus trituberculatus TaxID=210409 RepID=A0A5B7IY38_PORTR|nr:hypothetical protein [Portunus trituberculatus]